jgi:hypothetical protein
VPIARQTATSISSLMKRPDPSAYITCTPPG